MKKLVCLALSLIFVLSMFSGCADTDQPGTENPSPAVTDTQQGNEPAETEPHKIAVMFYTIASMQMAQMEYLENYVGPAFNVEFVFSEAIANNEAAIAFVENAAASGCEGLMMFASDMDEVVASTCERLGMYWIGANEDLTESVKEVPYYLGAVCHPMDSVLEGFRLMMEDFVSDGEPHNALIVTGGASMGNTQHALCGRAALEVMEDVYDLTFEMDLDEMAYSNSAVEVNSDKGIKAYIYPGYPYVDTYVSGLSSVLQSGEYDILITVYDVVDMLATTVDEVEKAFDFDIKVCSYVGVSESVSNLFETQDIFGNSALTAAEIRANNLLPGVMFVALYNAITGNSEMLRPNGEPQMYNIPIWTCLSAEDYEKVKILDMSPETYCMSAEDMEELLVAFNPEATMEDLKEFASSSTVETIYERRGLN